MNKVPKLRFTEFSEEWKEDVLENICYIEMGQSPLGETYNNEGIGLGLINGPVEFTERYTKINQYTSIPTKLCDKGDIILCVRGSTVGRMNIASEKSCIGRGVASIRNKRNKSTMEFLEYLLQINVKDIVKIATGSTFPNISKLDIGNKGIFTTSILEQTKIANFLSLYDIKIQKQQEKIYLLENYKKGLMPKIFSREIRFKGENGEDYPEWEEKTVGEIFSFYQTNSLSRDCLNNNQGSIMNIHYGDIHMRYPTLVDVKKEKIPYINESIDISRFNINGYCKDGDVVIADASEDYADIGKTIELKNIGESKILCGLHTLLARDSHNIMVNGFRGYLFQYEEVRSQIRVLAAGAKVLGISKSNIEKIVLKVPSKNEQIKIANFLSKFDEKIEKEREKLELMKELKKGLLQQMFV